MTPQSWFARFMHPPADGDTFSHPPEGVSPSLWQAALSNKYASCYHITLLPSGEIACHEPRTFRILYLGDAQGLAELLPLIGPPLQRAAQDAAAKAAEPVDLNELLKDLF